VLASSRNSSTYDLADLRRIRPRAKAVYHTNVLSGRSGFAVLCGEAISEARTPEAGDRETARHGHEVLEISMSQMIRFAGNILELTAGIRRRHRHVDAAWNSFDAAQRRLPSVRQLWWPPTSRSSKDWRRRGALHAGEIHLPTR